MRSTTTFFVQAALGLDILCVQAWPSWLGGTNTQGKAVSINEFEHFWSDPSDVIENLDDYETLWIQPYSCVWSECAVDETDDQYVGDYRDGDEQWYQYRTQEFCANAAFALYGSPKGQKSPWWKDSAMFGCTRRHFINSYFTYGGADNLLKAGGITPEVYFIEAGLAETGGNITNAYCIESQGDNNQQNNNNQGGGGNNNQGDSDAWTSTMGCSVDGQYVIALFESNTCDGNYYRETVDNLESYNAQHDSLGCYRVWDASWKAKGGGAASPSDNITYLMSNAWSCDMDLYPDGCPDPFGKKARYDFALRTISNGGNAQLAYKNMVMKRPLRVASVVMASISFCILAFGYFMKNHKRMKATQASAEDGSILKYFVAAYILCMWEDIVYIARMWWASVSPSSAPRQKRNQKRHKRPITISEEERAEALIQTTSKDESTRSEITKESYAKDERGKPKQIV